MIFEALLALSNYPILKFKWSQAIIVFYSKYFNASLGYVSLLIFSPLSLSNGAGVKCVIHVYFDFDFIPLYLNE